MNIGRIIVERRAERGMSMNQLAIKASVPKSLLSKTENGMNPNIGLQNLTKILRALGLTLTIK